MASLMRKLDVKSSSFALPHGEFWCLAYFSHISWREASGPKMKGARQARLPPCLEDDAMLTEADWQTIGYHHNILRH